MVWLSCLGYLEVSSDPHLCKHYRKDLELLSTGLAVHFPSVSVQIWGCSTWEGCLAKFNGSPIEPLFYTACNKINLHPLWINKIQPTQEERFENTLARHPTGLTSNPSPEVSLQEFVLNIFQGKYSTSDCVDYFKMKSSKGFSEDGNLWTRNIPFHF